MELKGSNYNRYFLQFDFSPYKTDKTFGSVEEKRKILVDLVNENLITIPGLSESPIENFGSARINIELNDKFKNIYLNFRDGEWWWKRTNPIWLLLKLVTIIALFFIWLWQKSKPGFFFLVTLISLIGIDYSLAWRNMDKMAAWLYKIFH